LLHRKLDNEKYLLDAAPYIMQARPLILPLVYSHCLPVLPTYAKCFRPDQQKITLKYILFKKKDFCRI
jgi:hypothetical protein